MLPTSGAISIYDICDEFGVPRTTPIKSFYRGGGIVPNNTQNAAVPASGAISFPSNFYGAGKAVSGFATPGSFDMSTGLTTGTLSNATTITANGGKPGYTYSTSWLSGGTGITLTGTSSSTPGFTSTGTGGVITRSGVARTVITDSLGATYNVDWGVTLSWG